MIPILTKHLTEHYYLTSTSEGAAHEGTWSAICQCGTTLTTDAHEADVESLHAAHVADTFQAALAAAGATTRTEWGYDVRTVDDDPDVIRCDRERAERIAKRQGFAFVSRTVVSMPWQPAGEVEA